MLAGPQFPQPGLRDSSPAVDGDGAVLAELFLGLVHLADEVNKALPRLWHALLRPVRELELPDRPGLAVLERGQRWSWLVFCSGRPPSPSSVSSQPHPPAFPIPGPVSCRLPWGLAVCQHLRVPTPRSSTSGDDDILAAHRPPVHSCAVHVSGAIRHGQSGIQHHCWLHGHPPFSVPFPPPCSSASPALPPGASRRRTTFHPSPPSRVPSSTVPPFLTLICHLKSGAIIPPLTTRCC